MSYYSHFTRKQASVLYAATKHGKLKMTKNDISRMYNNVDIRFGGLDRETIEFLNKLLNAIEHLFADRVEIAQACIDDRKVECKPHVIGHGHLDVTEENVDFIQSEINFFYEVGDSFDDDIIDGFDWYVDDEFICHTKDR